MADKISPIYVSLFPLLPLAFPEAMAPPFQHREGRGWGLDSELYNIPNPFYFWVLADKETAKGLAGSGVRQLSTVMYRRKDPLTVPAGCSDPGRPTRALGPSILPLAHSCRRSDIKLTHLFLPFQEKEGYIPTFRRGELAVDACHRSIPSIYRRAHAGVRMGRR